MQTLQTIIEGALFVFVLLMSGMLGILAFIFAARFVFIVMGWVSMFVQYMERVSKE
jgi:hypothetical protein